MIPDRESRSGEPRPFLFFTLVGGALLVAARFDLGLIWDGGFYLFKVLDQRRTFTPHNRWINVPLQKPTLWAQAFTERLGILRFAFDASYLAVPLIALLVCWAVLRGRSRPLFVWPVLGIGLVGLPGWGDTSSEAIMAVAFFWPVWTALLAGMTGWRAAVTVAFSAALYVAHPIAAVFFLVAAAGALLFARQDPSRRGAMVAAAAAFAAASVFTAWETRRGADAYEAGFLTSDNAIALLREAASGWPLFSFGATHLGPFLVLSECLALVAALALLFHGWALRRWGEQGERLATAISAGAIVANACVLVAWAVDPSQWAPLVNFHHAVPFFSLPLMAAAGLEAARDAGLANSDLEASWRRRARLVTIVGFAFSIVLIVQATAWKGLMSRLRGAMVVAPGACLADSSLDFVRDTPLENYVITPLSLVLQARRPGKIVLRETLCRRFPFEKGVPIAPWDLRRHGGWFDLKPVAQQAAAEQRSPFVVSFIPRLLHSGRSESGVDG